MELDAIAIDVYSHDGWGDCDYEIFLGSWDPCGENELDFKMQVEYLDGYCMHSLSKAD